MLIEDLRGIDYPKVRRNCIFLYRSNYKGRILYDHFTNFKRLQKTPRKLYGAINKIIKSNKNIVLENIMANLPLMGFISPAPYLALFKMLKMGKLAVVDPYPTIPKVIAASIFNLNYYSPFSHPELEQFLKVKLNPLDDSVKYDILLLDGGFREECSSDIKSNYVVRFSKILMPCLRSIELRLVSKINSGYILVEKK